MMEEASQLSIGVDSGMSVSPHWRPVTPDGLVRGRRLYPIVKRIIDIALALTVLAVISPLLVLIAVLIKVYSPGPVLFVQDRIGYDPKARAPRPFKMYKFRSMHYNADQVEHRKHMAEVIRNKTAPTSPGDSLKMKGDRRITGIGRILRKTSLDEFPQLINVLKGDMSMVGPRPALAYEVELYEDWHKERLLATPGLTGLWQVKARNRVSFDDMVRIDLHYIKHYSLGMDMKILLMTPVAVAKDVLGVGAG